MGVILSRHQGTNRRIFLFSVQVATASRGRGVLRLILLRQHVNLLSAPALLLQLISILYPSIKTSAIICLAFELLTFIVASSGNITNLAISLGR